MELLPSSCYFHAEIHVPDVAPKAIILQLYYISIASVYKPNISKAHVLTGFSHFISRATYWKTGISKYMRQFCLVLNLLIWVGGGGGKEPFWRGELSLNFHTLSQFPLKFTENQGLRWGFWFFAKVCQLKIFC